MGTDSLAAWLAANASASTVWFAKRLAAGDTSALEAHQRGPSLPRDFVLALFGDKAGKGRGGKVDVDVRVDSHAIRQSATVNWYDLKTFGGLRRETRIVSFRGNSPVTNPRSSGGLAIFVFTPGSVDVSIWLCRDPAEVHVATKVLGAVEPGWMVMRSPGSSRPAATVAADSKGVDVAMPAIPVEWRNTAPSEADILTLASRGVRSDSDDGFMVIRRRALAISQSVGDSAQTALDVVAARARRLLAAQLRSHAVLKDAADWALQLAVRERDSDAERWLYATEALAGFSWSTIQPRVPKGSYLLTLQEGLDEETCAEIHASGNFIVSPKPLHARYPVAARPKLVSVTEFLSTTVAVAGS